MTAEAIEIKSCNGGDIPFSKKTRKETLMSFRQGNARVELRLITPFDETLGRYLRPIPKVVFLVDDKYVRIPVDGRFITDLWEFLIDLGRVIEGIGVSGNKIDVDGIIGRIREAMASVE